MNKYATGLFAVLVALAINGMPALAAENAPSQRLAEPRIFIGAAWQDRLEELRDLKAWSEVAPHVGLVVHPYNINVANAEGAPAGNPQLAVLKEIAPSFGVREAIIERNEIPTPQDIKDRVKAMRSLGFNGQLYFYLNRIQPRDEKVTAEKIPAPDPRIYDRARLMRSLGLKPLFGLTPHVVYLSPQGFQDPGWQFLRDFSIFQGYCYDAPAELYVRQGKTDKQRVFCERYRTVVADSVRYAASRHMVSIYLLSAHGEAADNVKMAREVVRDLKKRNALPWAWGIEDYTKNSKLHMVPQRNADGTPADTITGLALWIREFYAGKVE